MKCIILAAGYATRLYPLTLNKPKPLLEIAERPMMGWIMDKVEDVAAVDKVFVVTNEKFFNNFIEWSKTYKGKKKVKIINDHTKTNEDRLGAIGDIDFVIKQENIHDALLIIAGDNLFEFSLVDMYNFFKKKKGSVIAARDAKKKELLAKKYGVIMMDKNNKITDFEEKPEHPKSTFAATCCYMLTKNDLEELKKCIEEDKKPDNAGDFIRYISQKKDVYCFSFNHPWFDIGDKEQLKAADEEFRKK